MKSLLLKLSFFKFLMFKIRSSSTHIANFNRYQIEKLQMSQIHKYECTLDEFANMKLTAEVCRVIDCYFPNIMWYYVMSY